ncbi:MAG TPA: heavy metal translocating P-type ATPase [Terracidiphilus sp.]|jgi:Cu+-exporting ATPase|nr:heavy metal translocating P-type ATPase [Terracidiphilus sp.]
MTTTQKDSLTLPVLGMTCASCQHHVESALRATEGVDEAHVDLMGHRATVVFDPEITNSSHLIDAIRSAGYDAVLPRIDEAASQPAENPFEKQIGLKAAVTIAAGALAMVLSVPLGLDMDFMDRWIIAAFPSVTSIPADLTRWLLLFLSAALIVWAGRGVFVSAARGLRHGTTNMNTLVSLGTGVAFLYSAVSTIWPASGGQVYYDAVLLILGFLLLGKALEARAKRRARSALDALSRVRPTTARRIVDGMESVVPLAEIQPGDSIVILPGEQFPVDATIVEGRTTVDESLLTGESTPQPREVGDRVLAGTMNFDGAVTCKAKSLGKDTVLSQITRMVELAQSSRTPMERLADQASSIFVPSVLAIATLTFGVWALATHSFEMALASAVSVLVIACPCAMGLAVPAALTVAVGRGAQLGVLFKGGEALERLSKVDTIVLDKTGTLTVGRPVLTSIQPLIGYKEDELLGIAAAIEERSNHPIAHAITEAAKARGLSWRAAKNVQVLPGRGVTGSVEDYACTIGNETFFREQFGRVPDSFPPVRPGTTRLYLAFDNLPVGCFDARDTLHNDAVEAVASMQRAGLRVIMLTGDSAAAAAPIANQAGISEVEAGLDPPAKLARIRELQQKGHKVAMVGDGVNDAAALAQADAGIAMGTGTDLAQEAGDVILLRAKPESIFSAFELSRATIRVMQENLAWATAYNLLGIPLAAGMFYPLFHILLSPGVAAAAMALSSVSVLANSLRLRRWHPHAVSAPR